MIRTPLRPVIGLPQWTFLRGKAGRAWVSGSSGGGDPVTLPHSWNERDTFQMGRHSRTGRGAYRTEFELPEPPQTGHWHLCTEGLYGPVEVWLDGRRLARTDAQFLGLNLPLGALGPGSHVLALRMDNFKRKNVLPGFKAPDFLLYGGLVGRVWLEHRPEDALDPNRLIRRPAVDADGRGRLGLPPGLDRSSMRIEIVDPHDQDVALGEPADPTGFPWIPDPDRWSPDAPNLYRARLTRLAGGRPVDALEWTFGFTTAEFRPGDAFVLNGNPTRLHGANRHESIPGLGAALPPELQRRDAEHLKGLGCNFVRLSHYPQHPAFLDACDDLGILVYPEIATWKSVRSNRGWLNAAQRQMRAMILRDRHRPSIILWGMGNESRSKKAYIALGRIIRDLDPDRCSTYAENHLYRARRHKTVGLADVWGTNYELDALKDAAAAGRTGTVVVSECCNHPRSVKGDEVEELTQLSAVHRDWEAMADKPFVAGYAVWCLTDYATEHRDRFRRQPGLLDAWRRPKMAADLFRARHSREPFVEIHVTGRSPEPARSRYRKDLMLDPDGSTEVHVFSNCSPIRLRVDNGPERILEDAVHWVLTTKGKPDSVSAEGTRSTVCAVWKPHGPASAVVLTPRMNPGPGRTVEIDLDVIDDSGLPAGDWNGRCPVAIRGDGRLRCFTEADEVEVSRGEGRFYMTCDSKENGEVELESSTEGLESRTLRIAW